MASHLVVGLAGGAIASLLAYETLGWIAALVAAPLGASLTAGGWAFILVRRRRKPAEGHALPKSSSCSLNS
jgi:hypothetical protein